MRGPIRESFDRQCAPDRSSLLPDRIGPPYYESARRAHLLLEVADILTEQPALSEMDINALEVVLAAAREHIREILWWSEQLPSAEREVDAQCDSEP